MKNLIVIRGPICSGKSSVTEELKNSIEDISIVDFDVFKRMIDHKNSSDWRRSLALDTALFMTDKIMEIERTILVNIHSSKKDQYELFKNLALKHEYEFHSFLLYPSLEVCKVRNEGREISDITYEISEEMIESYWRETFFIEGEKVFDTEHETPQHVAQFVLNSVKTPKQVN